MRYTKYFKTVAIITCLAFLFDSQISIASNSLDDNSKKTSVSKEQLDKKKTHKESNQFKLGKWMEIQSAVLKELSQSYVDSLPIDRIETVGLNAMLDNLDPYTMYVPEEDNDDFEMMLKRTYGGIGAIIYKPKKSDNVIINQPYKNSPAYKNGIVCGDEIVAINGESVKGLETKEASDRMKGKPGTDVTFSLKKLRDGKTWHAGDTLDVVVTRERIHFPDVEYAGMLNDTTGYLLLTSFTQNAGAEVREGFLNLKKAGMKKFVFDLRNNGGGIMQEAIKIVSLFVPKGSVAVSSRDNSGKEEVYRTNNEPLDTETPILVLVNSGSASSSEIVAGALQDLDRATIMGTRTFGKGLIQSIRMLPYNGQLKVTTGKYYTPSGRCVQAIDYSHRNEDGSVGHIPDSLTKEFKTLKGRTVRDGGGITPDVKIEGQKFSRTAFTVVYSGVLDKYVLKYVREHDDIGCADEFKLSEQDYEDFIKIAEDVKFDNRSQSQALYDKLKKELKEDGLYDGLKSQLEELDKAIDIDKATMLKMHQKEIAPLIEKEIVKRYYYQEAGARFGLKYDKQLHKALNTPLLNLFTP